jgi:predicted acyl esterase
MTSPPGSASPGFATDIYRPARDGRPQNNRRPVLLHRTPYNKTETEATMGQCRWFAARGYVVASAHDQ